MNSELIHYGYTLLGGFGFVALLSFGLVWFNHHAEAKAHERMW